MVYDHKKIEKKWREKWLREKVYQPDLEKAKKPFYNLMMFPYPSAEGLHVGNMYAFTGADVYGRFKRMQGYDVFEPIGLDGFGIHSENYALKVGKHPAEQAKVTEKHFYEQLSMIGNGFAWDQRLETYDPEYYKWTQWLFVQMFKRGLAYRGKALVNWCPSCKTVLADEQVEGGVCERCKTEVVKKEMEQWFFKITAYADRLLANLDKIDWPKKIKIAQRNWIGKKAGINITYQVVDSRETVTCFTTTPVNFGATFIVMAPEHPLVPKLLNDKKIKAYVEAALKGTPQQRLAGEKNKTGVFTGLYALNHVTGEKIPIWISDFVLMDVGTGAVQGCPGHDKRDFEFAKKFGLPIERVVVGPDGDKSEITREEQVIESGMPGKMVNSDFLDGMEFAEAMQATMDHFEKKGWGKRVYHYHLRDWLISRQRYWGPPIPMIHCDDCNWQPVPEEDLPVVLPEVKEWRPIGQGKSPLETAPKEWLYTKCPNCGKKAKRETDVSDTFLDSAWYFLRYPSIKGITLSKRKKGNTLPWDPEITKKWLPVDAYIGGAEHAVLHLLYSRFVWMFLRDAGLLPGGGPTPRGPTSLRGRTSKSWEEPFPFLFSHGLIIKDGAKMSKSRGNVVNPDEYIDRYGADALRMYLMFVGPYSQGGDFRDTGMVGMYRFLERVWRLFQVPPLKDTPYKVRQKLHRTIKKVTEDIAKFKYNTAIAALMELVNVWRGKSMAKDDMKLVVKLLAPLAPFVAEELWENLREKGSVHLASWPEYDPEWVREEKVTVVVQVNGRVRAALTAKQPMANSKEQIVNLAQDKIADRIRGKKISRIVWVPGRLVNFVIH